jgi:hypothetical protein
VAELALVKLANRLIEAFQQAETRGRNARFDDATVFGLALARDQAALFHAVEEPGHIRVVRNHALADVPASKALRPGAPEDAQNIVLRAREALGLQQLLGFLSEGIGHFLKGDKDAVLER